MVDWNGLYKWSMEYQDGTKPSEFKMMSKEDREWLVAAMKAHTFSETDRLTELVNQLKAWGSEAGQPPSNDDVIELLEEVTELAEIHARNNLNLCLMGGMSCLLSLIFTHEAEQVRRAACSLITSIVTNNRQV